MEYEKSIGTAFRLAYDGQRLLVKHRGRDLLVLPSGFVVGRESTAESPAKEIYSGSVNLRHTVQKEHRSTPALQIDGQSDAAVVRGSFSDGSTWQLRLQAKRDRLWFSLQAPGKSEVGFSFLSDKQERFLGFGEQFSHLDLSGKAFTLCTTEQGIGRGAQPISAMVNLVSPGSAGDDFTTYAPQPVFLTNRGRAMCFEQSSIYWCDIRKSDPSAAVVTVWGDTLSGYLFGAKTPRELIALHTAVTGRLRPLPPFAYGTILGIRGGREKAERILEQCQKHGAKVSAIWIEDWQGRRGKDGGPPLWWRWYPDESLYPDFKNWAADLKARGIALMGYANPFLSADDSNPLFVEAQEKRYLVQSEDGSDYITSFFTGPEYRYGMVDLTNPEAYDWLKAKMRTGMLENGLSGWMADYGEYIPLFCKTHSGNSVQAHCALPVLWAKLNSELIEETGNRGKVLTFHRSGGTGSNQYATAYWAGDQNPTFDRHDGLASAMTGLITGGISGMSINHTDIGGFTTLYSPIYKLTRKKEVLLRWLEFAAFTPIFRTHDGSYSRPDNYQFYYDEEGYRAYGRMSHVHRALGGYLAKLEREAVGDGMPMIRAMCLQYPEDPVCWTLTQQYMLGADLLVAPVVHKGRSSVRAYLPEGVWVCPHTGKQYQGGRWYRLPAPIGKPAVLIREQGEESAMLKDALSRAFTEAIAE